MTKIIGLTGGIGSGKTTIAKLFEAEGIPVYIADLEAKKIMQLPETIAQVEKFFGNQVVTENKIDTKKIAAIVFNNPEKLKVLNDIVHPLVKKHFDNWVNQHKDFPFVVKEAAILFESGSYTYCDKIITVIASEETRINRVIARDNCSRQNVLDRIKNQWSDSQRIAKSDFIIENENIEEARNQFKKTLKNIKKIY
jgi:dephospho-CoA kinase